MGSVWGIKQKTGDIYVAKTLDYELQPTVSLLFTLDCLKGSAHKDLRLL